MTPQQQTVVYRFVLGLVIVEIPVVTAVLASPTPDYRLLAIGLLGGLATAAEKMLSPQVATVIAPNARVMPDTSGVVITVPDSTPTEPGPAHG